MTTWWKCTHSSIRRDFSWSTSRVCGTHDPAASPKSFSRLGYGQDCWLATELGWWSLVFHELTDALSHVLCGLERCPAWVSDSSMQRYNILETEIFCRQYLNINNSRNKYFLMKFCNSVADILFIIKHTQFGYDAFEFAISTVHCLVLVFSLTQCIFNSTISQKQLVLLGLRIGVLCGV